MGRTSLEVPAFTTVAQSVTEGTLIEICQVERPLVATNRICGLKHKLVQVVRVGSSSTEAV